MIRMRTDGKRKNWLLIKETDEEADAGSNTDFLDECSSSITTGRSMDQIERGAHSESKSRGKP